MEKIPTQKLDESQEKESAILNRIVEQTGVPNITKVLVEIPNTDFQSLMLEVLERKSDKMGIKEIFSSLEKNPFVAPSETEQSDFVHFDFLAYNLLPAEYKSMELSPLEPFGTNKILAAISQKRILSTTRNSEIVSDPTTVLALHCARERINKIRENPKDAELVSMATSQRIVRQNKLKKDVQRQHFRTFTVMDAGRDIGFETFEKENLKKQLTFFLNVLKKMNEDGKYSINEITVVISNVGEKEELLGIIRDSVVTDLSKVFPGVTFTFDLNKQSNYYKSLCYTIQAKNKNQTEPLTIVGGGMTDWTQKLVGSKKERLLFGSAGSEVLCKNFKN
jgi:hypothetical protein